MEAGQILEPYLTLRILQGMLPSQIFWSLSVESHGIIVHAFLYQPLDTHISLQSWRVGKPNYPVHYRVTFVACICATFPCYSLLEFSVPSSAFPPYLIEKSVLKVLKGAIWRVCGLLGNLQRATYFCNSLALFRNMASWWQAIYPGVTSLLYTLGTLWARHEVHHSCPHCCIQSLAWRVPIPLHGVRLLHLVIHFDRTVVNRLSPDSESVQVNLADTACVWVIFKHFFRFWYVNQWLLSFCLVGRTRFLVLSRVMLCLGGTSSFLFGL